MPDADFTGQRHLSQPAIPELPNAPPGASARIVKPGKTRELWLALYFPLLPLRAAVDNGANIPGCDRPVDLSKPLAVFEKTGKTHRLISISSGAETANIRTGMKTSEAWIREPRLKIFPRDHRNERVMLNRLAHSLFDFSPRVAVHDDCTLAVEVGGSLRLYGGLEDLLQQLRKKLSALDTDFNLSLAPTPLAAILCARANHDRCIRQIGQLRSELGEIPLHYYETDKKNLRTLSRMGIRNLRGLFRLPREGLLKRLGKPFVDRLDRLLGERPDPQRLYTPQAKFHAIQDLDQESSEARILGQAGRCLLIRLEACLSRHDSAVWKMAWRLHDAKNEVLLLDINLGVPAWRADILQPLFDLRLESIRLHSPVRKIELETRFFCPRSAHHIELFPALPSSDNTDHRQFVDRVRSKLGSHVIQGLQPADEHRPEKAWQTCEPGHSRILAIKGFDRPLWLLEQPRLLATRNGHPTLDGPLKLHSERERICCGWWDRNRIARDYWNAITTSGQKIWIFKDLHEIKWYLHGIY